MTTDLAKQPSPQAVQFDFFNPQQFETMQRICKMFASGDLVPDMYKTSATNPENKAMANCMIAIDMSQRIGASPLMIMQNLVIIYGRPSWSSKFLIATVNTCGRFNPLQYRFANKGKIGKIKITEYQWKEGKKVPVLVDFDGTEIDNIECVAFTTAKGSNEELASSEVSTLMAINEGWYTKAGSKWKTMQKQMLIYRAASFWTSAYAPEISMGMKTEDEVYDIEDIAYEDVSDKVKNEINDKANKTAMSFEDDPKPVETDGNQPKPENIDAKKTEQTAESNPGGLKNKQEEKPKGPGF
jgi:hypothetical protein